MLQACTADRGELEASGKRKIKQNKRSATLEHPVANSSALKMVTPASGSGQNKREKGQRDGKRSSQGPSACSGTSRRHTNACAARRRAAKGKMCEEGSWRSSSGQSRARNVPPPTQSSSAAEQLGSHKSTATDPSPPKAASGAAQSFRAGADSHLPTSTTSARQESLVERGMRDGNGEGSDVCAAKAPGPGRWDALLQAVSRNTRGKGKLGANQRRLGAHTCGVSLTPCSEALKSPVSETSTQYPLDSSTIPSSVISSPHYYSRLRPTLAAAQADTLDFAQGGSARPAAAVDDQLCSVLPSQEAPGVPRQHDSVLAAIEQLAEDFRLLTAPTKYTGRKDAAETVSEDVSGQEDDSPQSERSYSTRQPYAVATPPPSVLLEGEAFRRPGLGSGSFPRRAPCELRTPDAVARRLAPHQPPCTNWGGESSRNLSVGALVTPYTPTPSTAAEGGGPAGHRGSPPFNSSMRGDFAGRVAEAHFSPHEGFSQDSLAGHMGADPESLTHACGTDIGINRNYSPSPPGGNRDALVIPPPPPLPPHASTCPAWARDEVGRPYGACEPILSLPWPNEDKVAQENQNKAQPTDRQEHCEGLAMLPGSLSREEELANRRMVGRLKGEVTEGVFGIPPALRGSNSGILWSKDVPSVSLLLTLPLNIPYGKILKFGSPDVLPPAGVSMPPLTAGSAAENGDYLGTIPPHLGSSHPLEPRALGAKKSYYCFSPRLHPGAYTLLSHDGGICDTFAASLHVELAIVSVPAPLLSTVASIFQALAPRLPRLSSPIKLTCGGLNERNAPGRYGGKVLTVSCAVSEHRERCKFQQMQDFLSVFQTKVEGLLSDYARKRTRILGGGVEQSGNSQRGAHGRCAGSGRKHNIWRYTMSCLPTSLNLPSPPQKTAGAPGLGRHAGAKGALDACAATGCNEEEEEIPSGPSKESSSGGGLDLTIRAFESKPLDDEVKEYAKTLTVPEVYVTEMRLITTHSQAGRTCEVDPRFPEYSIGTRPILIGPDGRLCRHALTSSSALPDVWEVRLRSGETRDMQKRLVQRCIIAAVEDRPRTERDALLKAVIDAGATLWVNGKILLTPPAPAAAPDDQPESHEGECVVSKVNAPALPSASLYYGDVGSRPRLRLDGDGPAGAAEMGQRPAHLNAPSPPDDRKLSPVFSLGHVLKSKELSCSSSEAAAEAVRQPQHSVPLKANADNEDCGYTDTLWGMRTPTKAVSGNYISLGLGDYGFQSDGCGEFGQAEGANGRDGTNGREDADGRGEAAYDCKLQDRELLATSVPFLPPGLEAPREERPEKAPGFEGPPLRKPPGAETQGQMTTGEAGRTQKQIEETLELLSALAACCEQRSCRPGETAGELHTLQQELGSQAPRDNAEGLRGCVPPRIGRAEAYNMSSTAECVLRELFSLAAPLQHTDESPGRQRSEEGERRQARGVRATPSTRSSLATCDSSANSPATAAAAQDFLPNWSPCVVNGAGLLDSLQGYSRPASCLTSKAVVTSFASMGEPDAVPLPSLDENSPPMAYLNPAGADVSPFGGKREHDSSRACWTNSGAIALGDSIAHVGSVPEDASRTFGPLMGQESARPPPTGAPLTEELAAGPFRAPLDGWLLQAENNTEIYSTLELQPRRDAYSVAQEHLQPQKTQDTLFREDATTERMELHHGAAMGWTQYI